jgi:hypothetical protein
MQIHLTKTEALTYLRELMSRNLDGNTVEVFIEDGHSLVYVPISVSALHALAKSPSVDGSNMKIVAIKFLREATPGLGLCEAKRVVEAIMDDSCAKKNYNPANSPTGIRDWVARYQEMVSKPQI